MKPHRTAFVEIETMEWNEIKISSILNIGFNTVQSISGRTSLLFEKQM